MGMFRQPGGMLEDWKGEFRRLGAREGMWVHWRVCRCVGGLEGMLEAWEGALRGSHGCMVGRHVREGKAGW